MLGVFDWLSVVDSIPWDAEGASHVESCLSSSMNEDGMDYLVDNNDQEVLDKVHIHKAWAHYSLELLDVVVTGMQVACLVGVVTGAWGVAADIPWHWGVPKEPTQLGKELMLQKELAHTPSYVPLHSQQVWTQQQMEKLKGGVSYSSHTSLVLHFCSATSSQD